MFVDRDPKGPRNDQSYSGTTEAGVAIYEVHNAANECVRGTLRRQREAKKYSCWGVVGQEADEPEGEERPLGRQN